MRIRTIKPGFWANEKMSRLPDFTRLLAIGLLNYADDHGYFWANPLMIRGALFPFEEDSSKIRRALAQLESEGYIRLGLTADSREAGHVLKFSIHQRVDRAAKSEIEPLTTFVERSSNDLRLIDDQSSLDRKGREGIGKDIYPSSASADAEMIYQAYPRKVGKQEAIKAILKSIPKKPCADLLAAVQAYAAATEQWAEADRQFIPHPSTWFNRGSYDDDPTTWTRTESKPKDRAAFA